MFVVCCSLQFPFLKLKQIDPDLTLHIFGSYSRREDPASDIDFVISHPVAGRERGSVDELLKRYLVKARFSRNRTAKRLIFLKAREKQHNAEVAESRKSVSQV